MIPDVGDCVLYKSYNRNGDVFMYGKRAPQVRRVLRILNNINGEKIIEWDGRDGVGACIPSTWNDWCNSVDESKRRGTTHIRF